MRWWKFFPCRKIGNMGIAKFSECYSKIEITVKFGNQKVHLSNSQCLKSSNSNHSRTTFSFTTSYFLTHHFRTYVITLLVPTLEMTNKKHSKLEFRPTLKIAHPTGWILGVVDNWCFYLTKLVLLSTIVLPFIDCCFNLSEENFCFITIRAFIFYFLRSATMVI